MGEVLKAERKDFDLDRGVWTKPSHHTKQKRREHVPLSPRTGPRLVNFRADQDRPHTFPRENSRKTVSRYKEILGLGDA